QRIEVMWEREDAMIMVTGQQPGALQGQPAFGLEVRTLGAGAMPTGVVPDAGHMPIRAGLDMAPQHGSAALHDRAGRAADMAGQGGGLGGGGESNLENGFQGGSGPPAAPRGPVVGAGRGGRKRTKKNPGAS